jgi:hypothetical protein
MASIRTTTSILTVLAVAASPIAFSQALPPALIACAIEKKDKVRLECFDREVARSVQASAGVAPAPSSPAQAVPAAPVVAATQPAAPPVTTEADEFGLSGELARKRREERKEKPAPTELRAAVSKVSTKPYGEYVIELDNGQVWEQPEKKSSFSIKAGDTVRITPGAMGSYFLLSDSGGSTKVRRVR